MTSPATRKRHRDSHFGFRHKPERKLMMRAIQAKYGHADLSATLRDAVYEYIDRHLLRPETEAWNDDRYLMGMVVTEVDS